MIPLLISIITIAVAACAGAVIIPSVLKTAVVRDLYDLPDERKIHNGRIPRLGGISFMPGMLFALSMAIAVDILYFGGEMFDVGGMQVALMCLGVCSFIAIYLVGLADDMRGVGYSAKFVVQIFAAVCLTESGMTIGNLNGCLGIYELHPVVAFGLTALVVVFITNAVNLIDGLDGLAGSICALIALYDSLLLFHAGEYLFSTLAFATLGVIMPFLCYNLFGKAEKRTKIFMGDTGSLTLGIVISFLCVVMANADVPFPDVTPDSLAVAFAPLLVPCLDLLRVFICRIRNHHSPFLPDKTHIHHRLLDAGLSQKATLAVILILLIMFTVVSVWVSVYVNVGWVLLGDIILFSLIQLAIGHRIPSGK